MSAAPATGRVEVSTLPPLRPRQRDVLQLTALGRVHRTADFEYCGRPVNGPPKMCTKTVYVLTDPPFELLELRRDGSVVLTPRGLAELKKMRVSSESTTASVEDSHGREETRVDADHR